jgi:predicted MFS family arabinose efflux permease
MAVLLMIWLTDDIRTVLWLAVLPAFIAVFLLIIAVHEPESPGCAAAPRNRLTMTDTRRLPGRYWLIVGLGAVFTLGRFSEAFLILRAQDVGLAIAYVPMVMIVMNIVYSLFSYPAGAAADRLSARILLVFGLAMLVVADVVLALAASPWITFAGAAFWGLHMAFTQGLLAKLVADNAPADLRGTAFGMFNLVSGVALFLASFIAGSLWAAFGASATFIAGASFAMLAAMGLLLCRPKMRSDKDGA